MVNKTVKNIPFDWQQVHVDYLVESVKVNRTTSGDISWDDVEIDFNRKFGTKLGKQAIRCKNWSLRTTSEKSNKKTKDKTKNKNILNILAGKSQTVNSELVESGLVDIKDQTMMSDSSIDMLGVSKDLMSKYKSSPAQVLEAFGYDPDNWTITSFRQSEWTQNSNEHGEVPLYAVKLSVKPAKEVVYSDSDFSKKVKELRELQSPFSVTDTSSKKVHNLLIIPIVDLHFGLIAHSNVTGNEYNMDIAEKRFFKILKESVQRCGKVDKIWLQLGSDFLNSDTMNGTTTAGTPQDNESIGIKSIFERAASMLVSGVKYLSAYTNVPVDITNVLSNHDELSSFALQVMLKEVFNSTPNINVTCSQSPRNYYKFGKNLIGVAHHIKNSNDVVGIMSTEAKEHYGSTEHKYFFLSHFHKEITSEGVFGIDIVRLPTVSGRSKWSNYQGYVGGKLVHQSFIINKDEGMINRIYVNCEDSV